jgi:hypothetical protein
MTIGPTTLACYITKTTHTHTHIHKITHSLSLSHTHTHTHIICNSYCLSTVTSVTRTLPALHNTYTASRVRRYNRRKRTVGPLTHLPLYTQKIAPSSHWIGDCLVRWQLEQTEHIFFCRTSNVFQSPLLGTLILRQITFHVCVHVYTCHTRVYMPYTFKTLRSQFHVNTTDEDKKCLLYSCKPDL